MPRVVHWVQNHSVEHYPTHITRQLYMPPGASYIVTYFQILSGGDRFANCVQWIAFVGSVLGVSLITKELVNESAQWIGMLVSATIPMAIAQSTTTQTDLVTSFWLVCLTYFALKAQENDRTTLFWIAASFSLAIVTKPTAIIFGFPLFLIFAFLTFRKNLQHSQNFLYACSKSLRNCIWIGVGGLVLSLPSWTRNFGSVGNFLGADQTTRSQVWSLPELLSNLLKNAALNLPIPGLAQLILAIHEHVLKVDINEPRLNFAAMPFDTVKISPVTLLIPSEDNVANPLHFILGFFVCLSFLSKCSKRNDEKHLKIFLLGMATIGGFILFCYLLKWQAWGNRLMLPLFLLQAPILSYYLVKIEKRYITCIFLVLASTIATFYTLTPIRHPLIALPTQQWSPEYLGIHQSKSILSLKRDDIYYSGSGKRLRSLHHDAVNTILHQYKCRNIGFISEQNDWEYPIWVLLNRKTESDFRMKHVAVQNESKNLQPEFSDAEVCALLTSQGKTLQLEQEQSSLEKQLPK
ncbi:MAG: glycosyltransferase family 39 protein [Leptolyngbya sp. Prado105]|nr:glycosyltransferase family 39 protein [Leptolyngbya sp. Prado105]